MVLGSEKLRHLIIYSFLPKKKIAKWRKKQESKRNKIRLKEGK